MSSEESEADEQTGEDRYYVKNMLWRRDIERELKMIDVQRVREAKIKSKEEQNRSYGFEDREGVILEGTRSKPFQRHSTIRNGCLVSPSHSAAIWMRKMTHLTGIVFCISV